MLVALAYPAQLLLLLDDLMLVCLALGDQQLHQFVVWLLVEVQACDVGVGGLELNAEEVSDLCLALLCVFDPEFDDVVNESVDVQIVHVGVNVVDHRQRA